MKCDPPYRRAASLPIPAMWSVADGMLEYAAVMAWAHRSIDAVRKVGDFITNLDKGLRGFDQLHFAVSFSMQHAENPVSVTAKDKDVTVAKFRFLDRFFQGHGTQCD